MASTINASTSPAAIIQTADGTGILSLQTGNTTALTIDTSQNTTLAGKLTSAGALTLASNGTTTALTIDTSQRVGIGTSSPTQKLHVYNSGGGTTTRLQTGTNANGNFLDYYNSSLSRQGIVGFIDATNLYIHNDASAAIIFDTANTERMQINSSGSLILAGSTAQKASGTTWSNPSDQRLKDNIRDYTKGTTELMQVRVREWEYNGKGGTTEGLKGLGVVADEVMTVLPNTVETYDAKLNADDEETTAIKKFDATEITWLLVKTVQEQQTIINDLKARITALEGAA